VRKRAKEAGIDLADVRGTGPEGRITRGDLDSHLARPAGTERPPLVGTLVETAEDLSSHTASTTTGREVRLSPTRRAIADRLSRSWSEIPHVTTYDSFDASRILQARRDLSVRLGRKVPIEALMIKAIVPALRAHPEFNATLRGDILTLHDLLDIGIAVDGGDGLLVAVARSVDELSIGDLATEIDRLVGAARSRSLSRQDATGATFTLSNIGAVGGGFGTPLIPLGTTAILSIGRASDAAVARNGAVAIAPMAPLSLSYDHRVIDGALGRQFMAMVTENLTDPIHVPK
jgi:pyruvate dehydrogenase E2 component (dihydrolipoamide acetyltransferase)